MKIKKILGNGIIVAPEDRNLLVEKPDQEMGLQTKEKMKVSFVWVVRMVGEGTYNPELGNFIPIACAVGDRVVLTTSDKAMIEFWNEREPILFNGEETLIIADERVGFILEPENESATE